MPGLTTAFAQGVAASRPAAATSNAGYVYFATDTGILSQSTGSSWTTIGPAVALDALTTKGDLLSRTSSAYGRLGVGSNDQVLTADSTASTGIKWATPAAGFADPLTTRGDLIVRGGSGTTRLALGSSGQYLKSDGTDAQWAAAAAASLTTASANLGSDQALTGTLTDIVTISCAAGTWLLFGQVEVQSGATNANFGFRLYDGTTVYASTDVLGTVNSGAFQGILISEPIVLGSTTTLKMQGYVSSGSGTVKYQTFNPSGGVKATGLRGLKVA